MNPSVVTLEGDLVRLEPLERHHVDALVQVGLHPSIWEWNTREMTTRAHMEAYVEEAVMERERGVSIPFAIVSKQESRAIGSTRYGAISTPHKRLEIGWTWIGVPWQRTGINSECKLLLMTHAFEVLGCRRLEFKTDARNHQSRNAILRIGAKEEGVLRSHMISFDGRVRDTVYFSILDSEWPGVKAGLLARMQAYQ